MWLHWIAIVSLSLGLLSAVLIAADILRGRRQKMWIMNVVWLFGSWIVDYIFAFAFGIAFQYFSIKPMRNLSPKEGLKSALKADSASLTAWQVGMYGWMAISVFLIFGHELAKTDPVFWFMMQIAMLAGFLTAYPVNWWLISTGIKEKM